MAMQLAGNATIKVAGIAVLALLMLIPLAKVEGLVQERQQRASEATAQIAQRWGAVQYVGGAVLVVPVRRTIEVPAGEAGADEHGSAARRTRTVELNHYLLPERLDARAVLQPELRSYGLYSSVVYLAEITVQGHFNRRDLAQFARDGGEPQWQRAQLHVPIADVHGIRRASPMRLGEVAHEFEPSGHGVGDLAAITVPWPELAGQGAGPVLPFAFELTLAGSERIAWLPLARNTQVQVAGAWPDPGFDGEFLPAQRQLTADGFSAQWQVLDLNRSIAQFGPERGVNLRGSEFGVSLLRPVGPYQSNTRAGKYGVLFVVFTFATFFLFEILRGLRLHPLQYLLVGAALCTFYVLLLALSEHIGFALSYALAALAIALLIGSYAAAVLRQRRSGAALGMLVAVVYALLYGLIVSEDYALLMGALALLAALAAVMLLTRKVDWYALGAR